MIEIDGSQGEGGGQIVRTSLALSLLTGKKFRIFNLRAGRKKPGLKRQHLTAVLAAAEVGNASVEGAELGSRELVFAPGKVSSGNYHFQISTAGSVNLVFQTVLPALMLADSKSHLKLTGGTHNMMAPAYDFLERSFVPIVNRMGPRISMKLNRYGFYPAGGGEFEVEIEPETAMRGIELMEQGKLLRRRVRAIVSKLPVEIARRETARVVRKTNWDRAIEEHISAPDPRGPGNVLFAELEYENLTTVFTAFGAQGIPAEKVADAVVRDIKRYRKIAAPVGPHLADQIMLPMALAAAFSGKPSRFLTGPLTQHSKTHADIIQRFLAVEIRIDEQSDGSFVFAVS